MIVCKGWAPKGDAMQRKSLSEVKCGVARTLDLLGEWWTFMIIRDAFAGMKRFKDFQSSIGLAKNILSARLKKLVENDILEQRPASDGTAHLEYTLTARGMSLATVMLALRQWGETNLCEEGELDTVLVDKKTKQPVKLEMRSQKGRLLQVSDLEEISREKI